MLRSKDYQIAHPVVAVQIVSWVTKTWTAHEEKLVFAAHKLTQFNDWSVSSAQCFLKYSHSLVT
jgi:hypothetical protein